ncbi:minor tail protein [Mycobacterium phage Scowl]|nr:minor tail protein [Mycobacterium phage Scowl]
MTEVLDWLAVASGPAGIAIGIYGEKWRSRRREPAEIEKTEAEASQIFVETAVALIAPLKAEIADLTVRVNQLEEENYTTKTRLQLSIDYIRVLQSWISKHIPGRKPPAPPAELLL